MGFAKKKNIISAVLITYIVLNACEIDKAPANYEYDYVADYESVKAAALAVWTKEVGLPMPSSYTKFYHAEFTEVEDINNACRSVNAINGCYDLAPNIIYLKATRGEHQKADTAGHELLHLLVWLESGEGHPDSDHSIEWVWDRHSGAESIEARVNEHRRQLDKY